MDDVWALPICRRGQARVKADTVNVRADEGLDAKGNPTGKIVASLKKGQAVDVWAVNPPWWLVQVQGSDVSGFSFSQFYEVVGELVG